MPSKTTPPSPRFRMGSMVARGRLESLIFAKPLADAVLSRARDRRRERSLRQVRQADAPFGDRPERTDVPAGKPLALALHALLAGNLTLAGGIARSVANLDLTLSLVMADDQAIWRDAGPGQLERMRRRAVGEQLFAAAKHDRHREDAHGVDQVIGEQRVDELGAALGDQV